MRRFWFAACAFAVLALIGCGFAEYLADGGSGAVPSPVGKGSGPAGTPGTESEWLSYAIQVGLWIVTSAAAYVAGDRRGKRKGADAVRAELDADTDLTLEVDPTA